MRVADFDFELPPSLIAQDPRPRGDSRLLVVDRASGTWAEHTIRDLPSLLAPGDLLVVNDTRVFPARLLGHRNPSGGRAECLLLERTGDDEWDALVHPGQKLKPGSRMVAYDRERAPGVAIHIDVLERRFFGRRRVRLTVEDATVDQTRDAESVDRAEGAERADHSRGAERADQSAERVDKAIDAIGHVPLPPYIGRADTAADRERYQTVYARARGSIAAPTAGLHFDAALLDAIAAAGIGRAGLTLHVGYGTFKPVRVDRVEDHRVDAETFDISEATAQAIAHARSSGHRIVAVGTTTTRAIESAVDGEGVVRAGAGTTELFIRPGHTFRAVDALLTNFHLPRSSLLMLVAAFGGHELVLAAYRDAVARGFRFYSYGDAMLVR